MGAIPCQKTEPSRSRTLSTATRPSAESKRKSHDQHRAKECGGSDPGVGEAPKGSILGPFDQESADRFFEPYLDSCSHIGRSPGPSQLSDQPMGDGWMAIEVVALSAHDANQAFWRVTRTVGC